MLVILALLLCLFLPFICYGLLLCLVAIEEWHPFRH